MGSDTEKQKAKQSRTRGLKPFKPGQSGNPKGRPKKEVCLTSLLKEELEKIEPKTGVPYMQLVAMATIQLAMRGNATALKEVWERVDGKITQPIDVKGKLDHDITHFNLNDITTDELRQEAGRIALQLEQIANGHNGTHPAGNGNRNGTSGKKPS